MKNEKVCISTKVGYLSLFLLIVVGAVLLTSMLAGQQTSTNSRASEARPTAVIQKNSNASAQTNSALSFPINGYSATPNLTVYPDQWVGVTVNGVRWQDVRISVATGNISGIGYSPYVRYDRKDNVGVETNHYYRITQAQALSQSYLQSMSAIKSNVVGQPWMVQNFVYTTGGCVDSQFCYNYRTDNSQISYYMIRGEIARDGSLIINFYGAVNKTTGAPYSVVFTKL